MVSAVFAKGEAGLLEHPAPGFAVSVWKCLAVQTGRVDQSEMGGVKPARLSRSPVVPFYPFLVGRVPHTKIDYRKKKRYPYSSLSTERPSFCL